MLRSADSTRSTSRPDLVTFAISEPRREGRAIVIAVAGELDVATAPQLQAILENVVDDVQHGVVVDLSATTFIDSTALRVLVEAQDKRNASQPFVVVCDRLNVLRILKIAAFGATFKIFTSLENALAYVGREPRLRT